MATGNPCATADTPEEIADIFNNYFTSVFSVPQEDKEDNGIGKLPAAEPPFSDIVLHIGEVVAPKKSLEPNKATGPDEILARILKETASTIAPSLCKLFNRSLGEGCIPSEWKLANVVPVYETDEKDHVDVGRSSVTSLLETLDYIGAILDRAGQVDCVYLDMSKAFDKVRHDLLMEKSWDAGFGGNLPTWFHTYLCGRCNIR